MRIGFRVLADWEEKKKKRCHAVRSGEETGKNVLTALSLYRSRSLPSIVLYTLESIQVPSEWVLPDAVSPTRFVELVLVRGFFVSGDLLHAMIGWQGWQLHTYSQLE